MNFKQILLTSFLSAFALSASGLANTHDEEHATSKPVAKPAAVFAGDPYLLDVDVVTGKALGPVDDQVKIDFEGRELRFSSQDSGKAFRASPVGFIKKIDALMVTDQMPFYPLTKCMVTDEVLGGEMGDAVDFIYKNRLVRFCCKGCIKKFNKDPNRYMAELNAATIKAQVKAYPFKTCMISGDELGGEMGDVVDHVAGGRLVRFCCKMCVKKFKQDPAKYISKLEAARKGSSAPTEGDGHGDHGH